MIRRHAENGASLPREYSSTDVTCELTPGPDAQQLLKQLGHWDSVQTITRVEHTEFRIIKVKSQMMTRLLKRLEQNPAVLSAQRAGIREPAAPIAF